MLGNLDDIAVKLWIRHGSGTLFICQQVYEYACVRAFYDVQNNTYRFNNIKRDFKNFNFIINTI